MIEGTDKNNQLTIAKRDGCMAKSVARQLAKAVLWVRIQISLKNHKLGDISEGVADTLGALNNSKTSPVP